LKIADKIFIKNKNLQVMIISAQKHFFELVKKINFAKKFLNKIITSKPKFTQ